MVLSMGGVDLTSVPKKLLQEVHWFLPANTTNFDEVHLRLDSRIFLYEHDLCSESIKLSEVYAIKSEHLGSPQSYYEPHIWILISKVNYCALSLFEEFFLM